MQMAFHSARGATSRMGLLVKKTPSKRPSASRGHILTSHPRTNLPFLTNIVRRELKVRTTPSSEREGAGACSFKPYSNSAGDDAEQGIVGKMDSGTGASKIDTPSHVLFRDDRCVIIRDAYPKSAMHCLVLPLDLQLLCLNDLRAQHIPLLHHMLQLAKAYAEYVKQNCPDRFGQARFITGFHALPSLPLLHMHLMSMDLDSVHLKTKKHYNSFATNFFLTSERVIADLEAHGQITINADVEALKSMEEQGMKCLWCGMELATVPVMKQHIKTCTSNMSLDSQMTSKIDNDV